MLFNSIRIQAIVGLGYQLFVIMLMKNFSVSS